MSAPKTPKQGEPDPFSKRRKIVSGSIYGAGLGALVYGGATGDEETALAGAATVGGVVAENELFRRIHKIANEKR